MNEVYDDLKCPDWTLPHSSYEHFSRTYLHKPGFRSISDYGSYSHRSIFGLGPQFLSHSDMHVIRAVIALPVVF